MAAKAVHISSLSSKAFPANRSVKVITTRRGYGLERIPYGWSIPQDQLLVHMPLAAAPEELSAVSSRAIICNLTAERQELLHLVLELKLPQDAYTVFSATDSVQEALGQICEPLIATNKFAVLCVDFSDSGIPHGLLYYDGETVEILRLNPES